MLESFARWWPRKRVTRLLCLAAGVSLCVSCDDVTSQPSTDPAPTTTASQAAVPAGPKVYEQVVLSEVYEVDKIYKSMQGPASVQRVGLIGDEDDVKTVKRELLWIVGFEAVMVDPEGKDRISQEFMCHTNLDLDIEDHQRRFKDDKRITGRLFTLSQGQYRIDLPKGFGIPMVSDELVQVNTQVLNLNQKEGTRKVRHRVIMRYVRDAELDTEMKALFVAGAFGLKLLEGKDGHYGLDPDASTKGHTAALRDDKPADHHGDHGAHGEHGEHGGEHGEHTACLAGANAGKNSFDDGKGRTFTGHWVVEPGKEVNHTRVTELMDLPFDTKVHYVAVHLHPFAESLELRDITTGKTVYKAKTRQADTGIGLAHVDFYADPKGFPLFTDHEYEVVSVYNNTSSEKQDSMAVLNLYMHDKKFVKPDLSKRAAPSPAASTSSDAAPAPSSKRNAPNMMQ